MGIALVLATFADINAILVRWDETVSTPNLGRLVVWRDTLGVIRDFWLTGTGAGTYQKAMIVYQVALRGVNYFNHAHNHYLQVASEGGLLLSVPAIAALLFLVNLVRQRLHEDLSPTRWLRIGAATGLFSVAMQSVWETGLRLPGNAILCAALWAIAVHQSPQQTSASQTQRRY